jgi:hypothetical protein
MLHCDRQSLEKFFQGGDVDSALIAEHLVSCVKCYRSAAAVVAELDERGRAPGKLSPAAIAFREIIGIEESRARAEVQAKGLVSLFLALDSTGQKKFLRSDPRSKKPEFVRAIIQSAKEKVFSDPKKAATLCNYGLNLVDEVEEAQPNVRSNLRSELLMELGNARRLQVDLESANELLDRAYRCLKDGSCDPGLMARLGSIRASVRLDDGKPDEALLLLFDVKKTYERTGESLRVGRTMVQIADIVSVFDPMEAYEIACDALPHLGGDEDLRSRACARGMMIECLIEQNRTPEALREYREQREFLYQFAEPAMQVRVRAMEARLAALLKHDEEALRLFLDVIDECFELGLYLLMTCYQLLLLGFYVDRKRWAKAGELCSFAAMEEEVPPGVRALWKNLEERTRAKTLEAVELKEIRRLLRAEWR